MVGFPAASTAINAPSRSTVLAGCLRFKEIEQVNSFKDPMGYIEPQGAGGRPVGI